MAWRWPALLLRLACVVVYGCGATIGEGQRYEEGGWQEAEGSGKTIMGVTNWNNGSGDRAWTNAANWTGVVPIDGDDVTLLASASGGINGGPLTGLTQNTILLSRLTYEEGATYDIGTISVPLEIACALLVIRGTGTMHYESSTTVADDTAVIVVDSPNQDIALWISSDGTSQVIQLLVVRGGVTVSSGLTAMSRAYLAPRNTRGVGARITVESAIGDWTTSLYQNGGIVDDNRGVSAVQVLHAGIYNGNVVYQLGVSVHVGGGVYNLNATTTAQMLMKHTGGTVDLTAANAGQVKSIFQYNASPKARLIHNPSVHTVVNFLEY